MAITEFISGHWYVYKGTKKIGWNPEGKMDFILDGMPHQCKEGDGNKASFHDSIDPDYLWNWNGYGYSEMNDFYDASDEVKRDKLQEFLEV